MSASQPELHRETLSQEGKRREKKGREGKRGERGERRENNSKSEFHHCWTHWATVHFTKEPEKWPPSFNIQTLKSFRLYNTFPFEIPQIHKAINTAVGITQEFQ